VPLRSRVRVLRILVVLAAVLLSSRLLWIQTVRAEEIAGRMEELRVHSRTLLAARGTITDRDGNVLAISVATFSVAANSAAMDEEGRRAAADLLAPVLGLAPDALFGQLQGSPKAGNLTLKTGLTMGEAEAAEALLWKKRSKLGHVWVKSEVKRFYPQSYTANQVLGYVDGENHGQYGLESWFDKQLQGQSGQIRAEFTRKGAPIEGTVKVDVPATPGQTVVSTLSLRLQQLAETRLERAVSQHDAKQALALVMDVQTGEILVMAMRPGADPGDRTTWGKPVNYGRLNNWAVTPMSPGSIFKPVVAAAALEENAVSLSSLFVDKGELVIDGQRIQNWDGRIPTTPLPSTLAELMQQSSNVGLIQVGRQIPHEAFERRLRGFGFMEKTGIEVPGEQGAVGLDRFEKKKAIDWASMYIGQHLEVTPVQMITAIGSIANGGYLVQPHLVREVRDADGKAVWKSPSGQVRQAISSATAAEVRSLMIGVVEKGTGSLAKSPGYTLGGKTGTAQKFERGRLKERGLVSFIGFAPAASPRIVMLIMVDEPGSRDATGGSVAAPIFADLLPAVMQAVGVAPQSR